MSDGVAPSPQITQLRQLLRVATAVDADEDLVSLAAQLLDASLKSESYANRKLLEHELREYYEAGSLTGGLHDQAVRLLSARVETSAGKMQVKTACEEIELVLKVSGADTCATLFSHALAVMSDPAKSPNSRELAVLLETTGRLFDEMGGGEDCFSAICNIYMKIAFQAGVELNEAASAFNKVTASLDDGEYYKELIEILEQTPVRIRDEIGEGNYRKQLWQAYFFNDDDALAAQLALSNIFSEYEFSDNSDSLVKIARSFIATRRYKEARVILLGILSFSGDLVAHNFDDVVEYLKATEGKH